MTAPDAAATDRPGGRAPTPGTPVIRLAGVTKRFGGVTAVDGVTLEVAPGEFFSLLGPSGCGKTTTLRMLAGFETPDAGRIEIDGRDVTGVPPNRRDLNLVFQNYALFPHLDVADNVAFGLKRQGLDRDEIDRRVRDVLALVELPRDRFGPRRPKELSGGQQQRVALARALVKQPRALLLDEPLGALDLKLRRGMQLELKGMQHDLGVAFVYVTHDQEEALTMSDRLAVMDRGRVVQVGTPRAVYERPATRFVADFIGLSNLVDLTVQRWGTDVVELAAPGGRGRVAVPRPGAPPVADPPDAGGARVPERLAVCVRPEDVTLGPPLDAGDGEPGRDRCWLPGTVTGTAYLGSEVQVQVEVAGAGRWLAALGARADVPAIGEDVVLRWPLAAGIGLR